MSSNRPAFGATRLVTIYSLARLARREFGDERISRTTCGDCVSLALRAEIRGDIGFVIGVAIRFQFRIHQLAVDFDLKQATT